MVEVSVNGKKDEFAFMEKHITKILNSNGYFGSNVKIFSDIRKYEERLQQLAADPEKFRNGIDFKPDEQYPDLSREELMLHTIMAIAV